ncbi:MAG: hypothetical protein ACLR4Z_17085 [Butyricicoccaceae bacterium]
MMKSVLTLVSGREDRVLRRIRSSEIVRNPNQPRRYFARRRSPRSQRVSVSTACAQSTLTVRRTAKAAAIELVRRGVEAAEGGARRRTDRCALPAHQRGRGGLVGDSAPR